MFASKTQELLKQRIHHSRSFARVSRAAGDFAHCAPPAVPRKWAHPCTYLTPWSSKRDSNTTLPMVKLLIVAETVFLIGRPRSEAPIE